MFGIEEAIAKYAGTVEKKYAAVGGAALSMSYRDFAALEITKSIVSSRGINVGQADVLVTDAYAVADALVRAKKRNSSDQHNGTK